MSAKALLIKSARIIDAKSPFNDKVMDLWIEGDSIIDIAASIDDKGDCEIFEAENLHLSIGWMDLRANFNDPGHEDRESIESGAWAAAQGGFTNVALSPQTEPSVDSKASVHYILKQNPDLPINLIAIGAFSKGLKGDELSEIYDMKAAGATAFSHGNRAVSNSALMRLALLYNREIGPALQVLAQESSMRANGQMHEGEKSTWLGLKGIPDLAESLAIARDLALAEYCESPIHFQALSSKKGLELIREAQEKGQRVSADVNLMNLIYTDADLESYDTNLKVYPPLRSTEDRKALIEGLKAGHIKAIASDHTPLTVEEKRCEFDIAYFGAASLEGFFPSLNANLGEELGLAKLIECITSGPREILNYQTELKVDKGQRADLSFFNPDANLDWSSLKLKSKAANYPFKGKSLKGKALAIYQKGKLTKLV